MTAWESIPSLGMVPSFMYVPWGHGTSCPGRHVLGFASFPNSFHPAVFLAVPSHDSLSFSSISGGSENGLDLVHRACAEECHFVLKEECNAGSDQNGIALEDVNIPKPGSLVEGKVAGEE